MQDYSVLLVNSNGLAFPDTEAVNATGPQAQDGTEFIKGLVDNGLLGWQQALMDDAGLSPSGAAEIVGFSQILDSMKINFGHPGESVDWYGEADPATLNLKILLLHGQGILVADFPELVGATYAGDGNNPTAGAFYRADDAAGLVRNTAGIYFILPDARGLFPRYLDATGLVDVDGGGTRLPGEFQGDVLKDHRHQWRANLGATGNGGQGSLINHGAVTATVQGPAVWVLPDTSNPGYSSTETRPQNLVLKPGIRY